MYPCAQVHAAARPRHLFARTSSVRHHCVRRLARAPSDGPAEQAAAAARPEELDSCGGSRPRARHLDAPRRSAPAGRLCRSHCRRRLQEGLVVARLLDQVRAPVRSSRTLILIVWRSPPTRRRERASRIQTTGRDGTNPATLSPAEQRAQAPAASFSTVGAAEGHACGVAAALRARTARQGQQHVMMLRTVAARRLEPQPLRTL